ncbi:MAG: NAD(P)H-quinone oxidoreductase [Sandaracinaceae bacterium]
MPIARAVRIREAGGPEVLHLDRLSVPDPGPGQVLVEVAAAGLNRADLMQRQGVYPAPSGVPADVPGLEYAGRVAAVGPGVGLHATGDRVMGIVGGGAMATHLVAHEREVLPVPEGIELTEAAAIPEAFLTAYDAVFLQAGLAPGERLLIHAVASGVGTAALQLARWAGVRAIGTSRSEGKLERCAELGLTEAVVVDRAEPRFADEVKSRTEGRGVDVVLDLVGAAYLDQNVRALAPLGRMVTIGLMGGRAGELNMGLLLGKRLRLFGTVLRSRPLEEKLTLAQTFASRVVPLFAPGGPLRPVVEEVMPMDAIQDAHARMERNETFGKLVLSWSTD